MGKLPARQALPGTESQDLTILSRKLLPTLLESHIINDIVGKVGLWGVGHGIGGDGANFAMFIGQDVPRGSIQPRQFEPWWQRIQLFPGQRENVGRQVIDVIANVASGDVPAHQVGVVLKERLKSFVCHSCPCLVLPEYVAYRAVSSPGEGNGLPIT